jgi:hypothetical protein
VEVLLNASFNSWIRKWVAGVAGVPHHHTNGFGASRTGFDKSTAGDRADNG